jgi:hypothetical protein
LGDTLRQNLHAGKRDQGRFRATMIALVNEAITITRE